MQLGYSRPIKDGPERSGGPMTKQQGAERRRERRISLEAPLLVRRIDGVSEPFVEQVTGNISMAGVYFETEADGAYAIDDVVMASVSIPESQRRQFPFTRVAGRSRVVRIDELPSVSSPTKTKRLGIALEFSEDVTALTAIPSRG